ncbi:GNAT family N-acetyltransferase [Chryseobacterium sp.]|uniref:GNAT family N-acetyltransferase n=1 Tax=Chryseobacterium sp. TaxID=1871047 RepID=UPI0025B98BED|nr:GNAT family N-acetyltransferase [Chryseobacterium sp.]
MNEFPIIQTERLIISEFRDSDIPLIVEYLQDRVFSEMTSNIPYPYHKEDAEFWLKMSKEAFDNKTGYTFAIRDKNEKIIGAIGIHDRDDDKAELGYWLGVPYWNQGYVTEAAKAVIQFGLETLGLNKIFATHFLGNPSSGKVMQKAGMEYEALLKQHLKKDGVYFDVAMYSVLKNKS